MPKVSLQINLSPGDYPHAVHILPHQLKTLSGQVDEVILTIDTKPSRGRFADGWEKYKQHLNRFLATLAQQNAKVKILPVDYTAEAKAKVANYFFGTSDMPDKDYRGGPFYAYFFGLLSAGNNLVFHLDADIFLGGGSNTWIAEAVALLQEDATCFTTSPLPGPPHPDDLLIGQSVLKKTAPYTYQFAGMSTRLFLLDRSVFETEKLKTARPALRNQLKAIVQGNANANLPELIISDYMRASNFHRVDFLGTNPGLWSLHPPYRTNGFYEKLPQLIHQIENNQLPDTQQGFYDVVDEVIDWAEAREALQTKRWWKRILHAKPNQ
ncbi:hypothetical protein [Mucilaginibacter sp.]|uniref:hypothetical protein n=1 Tax=Mucilaginibacter sp. TaxID=1882438 RepID=UPI0032651453